MDKDTSDRATPTQKPNGTPTVSSILEDGTIVELVYQSTPPRTLFALYNAGRWTLQPHIDIDKKVRLIPFSPNNNLIKNEAVLLPSEPRGYGSEKELLSQVQEFIHRYVDFSPTFERVATYYVILSWLYDVFNDLPYLRLRGDFGTGKTRALLVIGSICYKPFFASGASTISPIFHTLNAFRGTLVFDEADFRFSDERAEIVKILNNGNVRGLPVLRTMMNRQRYDLGNNDCAGGVMGQCRLISRRHEARGCLELRPRLRLQRRTRIHLHQRRYDLGNNDCTRGKLEQCRLISRRHEARGCLESRLC